MVIKIQLAQCSGLKMEKHLTFYNDVLLLGQNSTESELFSFPSHFIS